MCEQNKLGLVDIDLLRCLSCDLIPKLLIEKYLVEICRSQNVPFEPDQTVMAQDEFWTIGQRYVQHSSVNDEKGPPPPPPHQVEVLHRLAAEEVAVEELELISPSIPYQTPVHRR